VDFLDEYRKLLHDAGVDEMKNISCDFRAGTMARPRWGRDIFPIFTVGFTHGYACCCPPGSRINANAAYEN